MTNVDAMGDQLSSDVSFDRLATKLRRHRQEHLLRFWDELDDAGQRRLARQIDDVDFDQVAALFKQDAATHNGQAAERSSGSTRGSGAAARCRGAGSRKDRCADRGRRAGKSLRL